MRATTTQQAIHKTLYKSSARDDCKTFGERTSYCLEYIKSDYVTHNWDKVDCDKCLVGRKVIINKEKIC